MTSWMRIGSRISTVGFMLWLWGVSAASGDLDHAAFPGLEIESLHISVEGNGDVASVLFKIDNHGTQDVVLQSVRSPLAREGTLLMRQQGLGQIETEFVLVPRHETLDFATSHLGVRLRGFTRKLETGETVPILLSFRDGDVEIEAHVHPRSGKRGKDKVDPTRDVDRSAAAQDDRLVGPGS